MKYETGIARGKTEEKQNRILANAVEKNDWDEIKNLNQLPNEVLEEIKELYCQPSDPNKWQRTLFEKHETIFDHLVYGLRVNHEAVKKYLWQVDKILDTEKRTYSLFLQPPSPEHYHLIHAYNSSLLSVLIARELDFPEKAVGTLLLASTLADVGLTMIPNSFYLESGELSERADREITKHPIYSRKVARFIFGRNHTVPNLVGEHHERLNGSGYPNAKDVDDLSPLSSVINCADVYTAMIEARVYRSKRMPDEVIDHLKGSSDKFNDKIIRVISETIGHYPNGSLVKLSNGKLGLVKDQSSEEPTEPSVYVLTDENRNRVDNPSIIDISTDQNLSIELVLRTQVSI